jgi:hypothetical protein
LELDNGLFQDRFSTIIINPKETTEFDLSGMKLFFKTGAQSTTDVDFGPTAQLTIAPIGPRYPRTPKPFPFKSGWGLSGDGKTPLAVFPGTYEFSWNIKSSLDKIEKKIGAGEMAEIDLTPPDKRGTLKIHLPTAELPNPAPLNRKEEINSTYITGSLDPKANRIPITDWKKTELKAFDGIYYFVVNHVPSQFIISPGKTRDLKLGRIEVDHVKVTDEQGKEKFVQGTYYAMQEFASGDYYAKFKTPGSSEERNEFPTGTGINVSPGRYKVIVAYETELGPRTNVYYIDI